MADPDTFAWECRDKDDQARLIHTHPDRRLNLQLTQENNHLKKLLRENGISWSNVSQVYLGHNLSNRRKTRSSMTSRELGHPHLPIEIILRIMSFALSSPHPIIDPLSHRMQKNITPLEENLRKTQVNLHFLATCKALHLEGKRIFWTTNSFVFTTPQAVHGFADLDAEYRSRITHVTFRIIAQYYDDTKARKHKLDRLYHRELKRDVRLNVELRPKAGPLVRSGFRCYTWNQIVDFFAALRPPYDPKLFKSSNPRPALLPALTSLRLDLVNFADSMLPFSGTEFHDITSHEFGCTLNELQVTGMPFDDAGMKATCELSGLLKDEGLYMDSVPTFVQAHKSRLSRLSGGRWCGRVLRASKSVDSDADDEDDEFDEPEYHHPKLGILPPAPAEEGYPETSQEVDGGIIWKRVPVSRDDSTRDWVPFKRQTGYEARDFRQSTADDGSICSCCRGSRTNTSVLSFMEYVTEES